MDYTSRVITQYPATETLGGTKTVDGMMVGYEVLVADTYTVYFEVFLSQHDYNATNIKDYGTGYGGTISEIFTVPGVVALQWIQQVTKANQLESAMIVTVESDSGESTGQFVIPFRQLGPKWVGPLAAKLVAKLNESEG